MGQVQEARSEIRFKGQSPGTGSHFKKSFPISWLFIKYTHRSSKVSHVSGRC